MVGNEGNDSLNGGLGDDTLLGGAGDDRIIDFDSSRTSRNVLDGGSGDDELISGFGDDTLRGGSGRDTLTGGRGADVLLDGAGDDIFRYTIVSDSTATERDLIGLSRGFDIIDLSAIDASSTTSGDQAFSFIGSRSFINGAFNSSIGQVRYDAANNLIQARVGGSNAILEIESSENLTSLSAADFIL